MELVVNKTGAKSVSIIAHSMGNQPALQVLQDLRRSKPDRSRSARSFSPRPTSIATTSRTSPPRSRAWPTASRSMPPPMTARFSVSRNFYGGIPRAGDVPPTGPLVLSGIDTIDVTTASTDSLSLNHSGYAENNASARGHRPLDPDGHATAQHPHAQPRRGRHRQGRLLALQARHALTTVEQFVNCALRQSGTYSLVTSVGVDYAYDEAPAGAGSVGHGTVRCDADVRTHMRSHCRPLHHVRGCRGPAASARRQISR